MITIILCFLFVAMNNCYNVSLCAQFQMEGVYYFINTKQNQPFINQSINDHYQKLVGFCDQVEYYSQLSNQVIKSSMIIYNNTNYTQHQQQQLVLLQQNNASKGFQIIYSNGQTLNYSCINKNDLGCPSVSSSTLWTFFQNNALAYTIICEIVGILLMMLGVYIFRLTIVLLGMVSIFVILIGIESEVIFQPGVPYSLIFNVLALTGVCSLFVGYILVYFPKAGLFCLGSWIGLIFSLTLNNIAFYHIFSSPPNLTLWIVMPIFIVSFGILTICIRKSFTILATSLIGSYLCLRALSWHLGAFPNEFLYSRKYQLGIEKIVPWQFYLYVIALIILTLSSSALQYWLFTKKAQKNHVSLDMDQHFRKIQQKIQNQRQDLIQFEEVFQKQNKVPRRLDKRVPQEFSQQMQSNEQVQYQQPELMKKLVVQKIKSNK